MKHLIEVVADYVRDKHAGGTAWYNWSFKPEKAPLGVFGGRLQGEGWYARNVDLKQGLHECWLTGDAARRMTLERYYIVDWGGVRGNRSDTLAQYHRAAANDNIARGKKGIASWSKALCIRDPLQYAIFDARVAASLNALQIIHRTRIRKPARFPVLSSRNGTVKQADKQLTAYFRTHAWPEENMHFYRDYLTLCQEVARKLAGPNGSVSIYAVEMALFAHTEELPQQAFPNTVAG